MWTPRRLRDCLEYVERELRGLADEARRVGGGAAAIAAGNCGSGSRTCTRMPFKVRMIPAESVFGAFGAMTRQIAQDEGKEIEFRAQGLETQADRLVLQALKDPVMHLAAQCGIARYRSARGRAAAGKPLTGNVRLRIDGRGNRLNVIVEDDGRGLNLAAVRDRAVAIGVLAENEAMAADPQDIRRSYLSGRDFRRRQRHQHLRPRHRSVGGAGIGRPIARPSRIHTSDPGGLSVTPFRWRLSISTQQLLLVETAALYLACRPRRAAACADAAFGDHDDEGRDVLVVEGKTVPLTRLSDLLGLAPKSGEQTKAKAVRPVDFHCDDGLGR